MRSLAQTCAMPLTVVASRNMSPKATLTLPLSSSMAISWARSVGLQLSPDQIANSLEFSFLSSDEKFSDNKLVSNIFLSLSYRVTYKSYSVQTELMIIMPTKLKLTYSWRAHINLHKGTESNSNRLCLESLISAALENIYVAHSWWVHKSLQGTTESNSNRLCLESLIYVALLKTFMLPLRPSWYRVQ